jgi:hypothetical protein
MRSKKPAHFIVDEMFGEEHKYSIAPLRNSPKPPVSLSLCQVRVFSPEPCSQTSVSKINKYEGKDLSFCPNRVNDLFLCQYVQTDLTPIQFPIQLEPGTVSPGINTIGA